MLVTATLFCAVAATHVRAPPVPQWSRDLIASFTSFMESYVAVLPSQIYAELILLKIHFQFLVKHAP